MHVPDTRAKPRSWNMAIIGPFSTSRISLDKLMTCSFTPSAKRQLELATFKDCYRTKQICLERNEREKYFHFQNSSAKSRVQYDL